MRLIVKIVLLNVILGLLFVPCLWADEVEEAVKEGLQYYQDGDFSSAAGSLEYAAQLIRQKKGGELEAFLPEPLPGWTAETASSQAMGASLFGGGVTAERSYSKEDSSATVQIVTDSPMLQGVLMMLTNPAVATADGGRLKKINGQKAVVKYDQGRSSGEILVVVANRFLVTIEGSNISQEDLLAHAEGIDFQKMAAQ
ncbi:MAG TPA: hypothetical protein VJ969_03685 [Desulfopila sp.]|nr:hypothetical protein [Desulfopila sp.]